jgi:flagellar motor switch/type III secretory pathway protein FliN
VFYAMPVGLQLANEAITAPICICGSFRNEAFRLTVSRSDLNNLFRMAFPFAEWSDVPEEKQIDSIFDLISSLPRGTSKAFDFSNDVSVNALQSKPEGSDCCSFMLRVGDFVFPVVMGVSDNLRRIIDALALKWPKEVDRGTLRLLLRLCCGYAILAKDDLRDLEVGDVIEIDGPDRDRKTLSLILAESHFLGDVSLDEKLMLSGFRRIVGNVFGRLLMDFNEAKEDDSVIVDDVGSLKLTLVFEAGRKIVTLDELESISSGDLIQLLKPQDTVDILVGRQKIGEGEVVALDGGFGVRVSSLVGA